MTHEVVEWRWKTHQCSGETTVNEICVIYCCIAKTGKVKGRFIVM